MVELDREEPRYRFAEHKGYATPVHIEALREHGPCVHHRAGFTRVKEQLELLFANGGVAESGDETAYAHEGAAG
jgi:ribonuclease HII